MNKRTSSVCKIFFFFFFGKKEQLNIQKVNAPTLLIKKNADMKKNHKTYTSIVGVKTSINC